MNQGGIDGSIKENIGAITMVGAVLGLLPLILMLTESFFGIFMDVLSYLYVLRPSVSFDFYTMNYGGGSYFLYQIGFLYLPIIFYGAMLLGYFALKNGTPIAQRLIRFTFSVIFISNIISLLWLIFSLLGGEGLGRVDFVWFLGFVFQIAWVYISYVVIKTDMKSADDFGAVVQSSSNTNEAEKGIRFLNHLIDSICYIGVCSSVVLYFAESILYRIEPIIGIFIVGIIARFLYYPLFETLFGATPGKFLTGSKLVKNDGNKISFEQSLTRTIIRIVPFEPLSFFGKGRGWHDQWSKTKVVMRSEEEGFGGSDDVIDDF